MNVSFQQSGGFSRRRVALLGGTFDPVHNGHLHVAASVQNRFGMAEIIFVPSAQPPHKRRTGMAGAEDRMEMIRLALPHCPAFRVSDAELVRKGPSYTIDTVRHFKRLFAAETEPYFILGIDAFFEIDTWKSYPALFTLISFVVVSRPGSGMLGSAQVQKDLERFLKSKVSEGYRLSCERDRFVHDRQFPVFMHAPEPLDISSTRIRERVCKGRSIKELVPAAVSDYIEQKGLYR